MSTIRCGASFLAGVVVAGAVAALLGAALVACSSKQPPEGMVLVPAGPFLMGTDEVDEAGRAEEFGFPEPWYIYDHPAHEVSLPAFYIDKFEVTHDQYERFLKATGREPPEGWDEGESLPAMANAPVFGVTWFDADAYCAWAGKRLPSEAEWEKAARGTDGRRYAWGNEFNGEWANIGGRHGGQVTEVGSYETDKSPYGVYDMVGNVTEWTADWYQPYPGNNEQRDPAYGKTQRALRGSSKINLGHFPPGVIEQIMRYYARVARRDHLDPSRTFEDVGFRCANSA